MPAATITPREAEIQALAAFAEPRNPTPDPAHFDHLVNDWFAVSLGMAIRDHILHAGEPRSDCDAEGYDGDAEAARITEEIEAAMLDAMVAVARCHGWTPDAIARLPCLRGRARAGSPQWCEPGCDCGITRAA